MLKIILKYTNGYEETLAKRDNVSDAMDFIENLLWMDPDFKRMKTTQWFNDPRPNKPLAIDDTKSIFLE